MNCVMFEEKISQYVDGALDGSDARLVGQHLRTCAGCTAFADRLEYDRILLRTPPPECSEIDFACLRGEIRGRIAGERRGARRLPVLAAAASILVAAAIWLRSGHVPKHPAQTSTVRVESGTDGAPRTSRRTAPDGRRRGHAKSLDTTVETAASKIHPPNAGKRTRGEWVFIHFDGRAAAPMGTDTSVRATADAALEVALQEFLAAEEVPPPPAVAPASPVAIHIVTGDPNVVLILLQEDRGVSNE